MNQPKPDHVAAARRNWRDPEARAGHESKHTPGPWKSTVENEPGVFYHSYRIDGPEADHSNDIVCRTPTGLGGSYEANARLIAAAPDLLAALHAIVCHVDSGRLELRWTPEECARMAIEPNGNLDAARAAIAKATGNEVTP